MSRGAGGGNGRRVVILGGQQGLGFVAAGFINI